MEKSKKTILIYVTLSLVSALAIYYFFRTYQLKKQLGEIAFSINSSAENLRMKQDILVIDSLMLTGEYDKAIESYKLLNDSCIQVFGKEVVWRIQMAEIILEKEKSGKESVELVVTNEENDTPEVLQNDPRPFEVRKYDSINFALEKANLKIAYLVRQIEEKRNGEYLSFTTSKGKQLYYVGEVNNKKANGKGVAVLISGSRYEGQWKDNMRNGNGKFYWPDGQYYEGAYKDDKRHGTGTYYWPNGEKYTGHWENDQRNGQGTFFGKDDKVVAGIWEKDKLLEVSNKD